MLYFFYDKFIMDYEGLQRIDFINYFFKGVLLNRNYRNIND